jgi:hypothetical protein
VVLAAVMCALVPLAHATPPDQSWRPGIYDDADFDDVVLMVTVEITLVGLAVWPLHVLSVLVDDVFQSVNAGNPLTSARSFRSSRAPPSPRSLA